MAMIDKIRKDRMKKVKEFRKLGKDPYPSKSGRDTMCIDIVGDYGKFKGKKVTVAGRIMLWRDFGKIVFAKLVDGSGSIQLYIKKENLGDTWEQLKLYDVGDFVDAAGTVTKTKTGEISVEVKELQILVKAIRPLPEKWEGLKDDDIRFRKRYLDFLMNPASKEKITKRVQLVRLVRDFLLEKGFMEVENPSLEVNPAAAEAKPFITHINAYDIDTCLRICAGELWQKMSTIGGFEKVFEIARVYRNEGVDAEHNPEFTMVEFYWAFATFEDNIKLHEELFARMAKEITGGYKFKYHGKEIDMTPPYKTARYNDLFMEYANIDLEQYDKLEDLTKVAKEKDVELEDDLGWSSTMDRIFKQKVRSKIFDPVFVVEYPYALTPLAKRVHGNDKYVQMSQLVLDSMEMCRIYGELNDPVDQMERFKEQQKAKDAGDEETWAADYEFVEAMEYGMPPQTGSGIGLDRWAKVLTDSESLREVIAYPIMKPEGDGASVSAADLSTGKLGQNYDAFFAKHGVEMKEQNIPEIAGDEYLSMSKVFKKEYPTAVAGYAVIEGVHVEERSKPLSALRKEIVKSLRGLTKSDIDTNQNLRSFRDMYENMGIDWHSRRPSPEALLRRISQGRDLYSVNAMVDAYNLVVMTQQVSVGAFDVDHLKLPFVIEVAKGAEEIEIIGGEVKKLKAGEVSYFDQEGPYNLDYNYRDAERSKITTGTKNILINTEGVGDISFEQVLKSLKLSIAVLLKFCGGKVVRAGIVRAGTEDKVYTYDDKKITLVIADDLEPGVAMNVVGHLNVSIGKNADDIMGRTSYIDASGKAHTGISRYPVIILSAAKSKIREIVESARNSSLLCVDYPAEMFTTRTDDDLNSALKKKKEDKIEYYGVALCGDTEVVEGMTKGLSLFK